MKGMLKRLAIYLLVLMLACGECGAMAAAAKKTLTLPKSMVVIGPEAFCADTSIERVVVPMGAKELGSWAFAESSLKEILLYRGLEVIGDGAFMNCEELQYISIPSSCLTIGESAFEGCTGLKRMVLPKGTEEVSPSMFAGCLSMEYVVLPETIVRIGRDAFAGCSALTDVNLPESIEYIETDAFTSCPLIEVTVEEGSYAHEWCKENNVAYRIEDNWETEEL